MKEIDLSSWERKSHYEWFSSFADPSVALDVKIDITNVVKRCKEKGISSFATLMYIFCSSVNSCPRFRLRILNDRVFEIDSANVAYTLMLKGDVFVNCRVSMENGFEDFLKQVAENGEKYKNSDYVQKQFNNTAVIDDIYCSCTPWVNFLSVRQPIPDKSNESKSIPRVCWGKYYSEGDRVFTTVNITANHALVDGVDLGRVFEEIQSRIDNF